MREDTARDSVEIMKKLFANGKLNISEYNKLPTAEPTTVEKVFGEDTRLPVSDENIDPYSAIVRMIMKLDDEYYRGTGFFTKEKILLTAGHNAYNLKSKTDFTDHQIFINVGGKTKMVAAAICYVPLQYKAGTEGSQYNDWAIAKADLPEGESCAGLPISQTDMSGSPTLKGEQAEIPGFPGEVKGQPTEKMHTAKGNIIEHDTVNKMLQYTISTSGGNSGAPVIIKKDGKYYAAGIHVHGNSKYNSAKAIDSDIASKLELLVG